ncbi:MAG: PPOX class F420-dependent oxidoreductase [Acidimicrobiales bacterium]
MTASIGPNERAFLESQRLGRLATVDAEGHPHVAPVGFVYNEDTATIDIAGFHMSSTAKFRHVRRLGYAAFVVDEVLAPWSPRGIEIRGRAEALESAPGAPTGLIRIHAERVHPWGEGLSQPGEDGR